LLFESDDARASKTAIFDENIGEYGRLEQPAGGYRRSLLLRFAYFVVVEGRSPVSPKRAAAVPLPLR
jgi:hypothetical protein